MQSQYMSSQSLLNSYGLNMTTVSWEDTARSKNSCWGPNISDMTLCSNGKNCNVIRRPNFADVTVDHTMDNFYVTVGNENNSPLKRIKLSDYLKSIPELSMNVNTDEKLLCSTQACILNDNKDSNETNFNVRMYNYQTTSSNPAVLVIISTNQGTSAQVLDSKTTDVLFNKNGRKYDFVAERLKEERKRLGKSLDEPMTNEEKERNVIFIYQIPLVVPKQRRIMWGEECEDSFDTLESFSSYKCEGCGPPASACTPMTLSFTNSSATNLERCVSRGFDNAMLKVSKNDKGEFGGLSGKTLKRDENYPIRCTLQYYYLTDTMQLSENLVKTMSEQLNKFYDNSENKSSLVAGKTNRPTEPKLQHCDGFCSYQPETTLNKFL